MKQSWRTLAMTTPLLLFLSVGLWGLPDDGSFVLKGATVYPVSGPKVENAIILVNGGKIVAFGTDVKVPPDSRIIDLSGKVVIPGLIDIHSHLGFFDSDINEFPQPIGPENRALDALYLDSPDWAEAVKGGVVTLVTGPGSGERIGGQSITIKTYGSDLSKRILKEAGEVKMAVNAAQILGVADRVGSLEPGKDADVIILDGYPLNVKTWVDKVFVNGEMVFSKK